MANNLQSYTKADIYVYTVGDGGEAPGLLAEEASVTIDRTTGSSPVNTVQGGYSGETPGAGMCEISVDSAVPSTYFEMNPGSFMSGLRKCQFQVKAGNKTLSFVGFIYSDNFTHAVNTESKLSFKARGRYTDWE